MISKGNRLLGAILLISGTTIGAGMLALPVITGLAGFFPALLLITAVWLFMMLTAFYLLEVNLRVRGESNLISMVHLTLGRPGEAVSWVSYLLLLYSLTAAYLVGCSQIVSEITCSLWTFCIPDWVWSVAMFFIFACFVYFGTSVVDYLNRILMLGFVVAYVVLMILGMPHVDFLKLTYKNWSLLGASAPVVLTTFGFHIIIPTLTTYLDHDAKLLKRAIFIGSLIPFIVYLLWQWLTMGVVPVDGAVSLRAAASAGKQVTFFLEQIIGSMWVNIAASTLALFAIITSLLGVSLSLSDFLADGFKIKKTHWGKFFLILLTFLPPLFFALFYPQGFILALSYAGIFVAILLALLPCLMAWFERYGPGKKRSFIKSKFTVPGGKGLLLLGIALSIGALIVEVLM